MTTEPLIVIPYDLAQKAIRILTQDSHQPDSEAFVSGSAVAMELQKACDGYDNSLRTSVDSAAQTKAPPNFMAGVPKA